MRTIASTPTAELTDHVNRMCLTDSRLFLPGLNLAYTDRSSMSASTEVRVPFVDPTCSGRPSASAAARRSRAGPRRSRCATIAEGWMPREVVDRPKASFGAPLRAWVTNDLGPLIDDVLLDGELVASGFLRRPPLRQMVADQRSGRTRPVEAALAAALDGAVVPRRSGRRGGRRHDR